MSRTRPSWVLPPRLTPSMMRTLDALADIERGTIGRGDIAFRPHKPHPLACRNLEAAGLLTWHPNAPASPRLTEAGALALAAYRLGRRRGTRYAR